MTVLLSINNYYYRRGGAEVVFLEENRLFEEIGWNVIPFAMQHSKNYSTVWNKYFVDEIEYGSEHSIWNKIKCAHKVVYSLEARRHLDRLLNHKRPNVCHVHNIYHHISPSILLLLKKRGIPTVLTLHDLKLACPAYTMLTHDGICERCKNGRFHNVIKHRCIKRSLTLSTVIFFESTIHRLLGSYINGVEQFIVPSKFYINKFVEWGFDPELFTYIPNFVGFTKFNSIRQIGKAFVYFGRLAPEKGLVTLIKAAALAKVPLWIAGAGPEEHTLKRLAGELNVDATFFGYLSGTALHEKIQLARAVVLPSEWYENAPLSVMESYNFGVPVIGSNIGGIPELIQEGRTGIIFDSGSVDELAKALRRMADMPNDVVKEMGITGRRWIEAEFTAEHYRSNLLKLYSDLGIF